MTISAEDMAKITEAEQAIHKATPTWANGAFAIAVFDSLLLLLKKAWALPVFILSLVAILVQVYNAFLSWIPLPYLDLVAPLFRLCSL